jgi:membrane-bound lytic murein transglycosylase B
MAAHLGKREQARQLLDNIRSAYGAELPLMAGIAEVLALIGDTEEANQIAGSLKLLSLDAPISRFRQALLTLAMGDTEVALSFLTSAVAAREPELVWIAVDPRFDPIRQTAAFKDLAKKVVPGLPS